MTPRRKRCGDCGEVKPVEEFARRSDRPSGRCSRCKPCDRAKAKAYYAANRERRIAYYAERRADRAADRAALRAAAVAIYGGACAWCGSTEELEFDHVDNDGEEHRAVESPATMMRRIVASGAPITDRRLQLLCRPCHRGRGWVDRRAEVTGSDSHRWQAHNRAS